MTTRRCSTSAVVDVEGSVVAVIEESARKKGGGELAAESSENLEGRKVSRWLGCLVLQKIKYAGRKYSKRKNKKESGGGGGM